MTCSLFYSSPLRVCLRETEIERRHLTSSHQTLTQDADTSRGRQHTEAAAALRPGQRAARSGHAAAATEPLRTCAFRLDMQGREAPSRVTVTFQNIRLSSFCNIYILIFKECSISLRHPLSITDECYEIILLLNLVVFSCKEQYTSSKYVNNIFASPLVSLARGELL